jgi:formate dehydrogenase subunit gamma
VCAGAAVVIIIHAAYKRARREPVPSSDGKQLIRHAGIDRWFHWLMATSVVALLGTGVMPILGINFSWLTAHWVAGLVFTALILLHILRSLVWQDAGAMWVSSSDLRDAFDAASKPAKYSLAQKGMHAAMAIVGLTVIVTGIILFGLIDTPWWQRGNQMSEATLGWLFVLHGASTLALIGLIALHVYFGLRPEKRFYTRSMLQGWISEDEHAANHNADRWVPQEQHDGDSVAR